jgi:hypothetical protein
MWRISRKNGLIWQKLLRKTGLSKNYCFAIDYNDNDDDDGEKTSDFIRQTAS